MLQRFTVCLAPLVARRPPFLPCAVLPGHGRPLQKLIGYVGHRREPHDRLHEGVLIAELIARAQIEDAEQVEQDGVVKLCITNVLGATIDRGEFLVSVEVDANRPFRQWDDVSAPKNLVRRELLAYERQPSSLLIRVPILLQRVLALFRHFDGSCIVHVALSRDRRPSQQQSAISAVTS
jgi:hypothetical protein